MTQDWCFGILLDRVTAWDPAAVCSPVWHLGRTRTKAWQSYFLTRLASSKKNLIRFRAEYKHKTQNQVELNPHKMDRWFWGDELDSLIFAVSPEVLSCAYISLSAVQLLRLASLNVSWHSCMLIVPWVQKHVICLMPKLFLKCVAMEWKLVLCSEWPLGDI